LEDLAPETETDDQSLEEDFDLEVHTTGDLPSSETAGPVFAELLATRAELKRVETEVTELRDSAARRQADFENFRKRIERERSETYNRAVADLVTKLLPVLDNLRRAVDAEASAEGNESDEFRHFLNGVDLIHKQLGGVLEALGVKAVAAEGELFDPHLHEAVLTEESEEHEPDTVMQEIVRGYRLGDKLLRPALVKVAVKK
jgi:molecular chaperone GrpE